MFTGLVQRVGTLRRMERTGDGSRAIISSEPWPEPLERGESISVQGVCLTVAGWDSDGFVADVLDETFDCSTLGSLRNGTRLNLERALRLSDRLGGHLVSGHVDAVSVLNHIRSRGRDRIFRLHCPAPLFRYLAPKGSVALDGVSLTVSALLEDESAFEVNLIPTTWTDTSLADRREGDPVNLETDLLGRYVERLMRQDAPAASVSLDTLARAGFPV